MPISKGVCYKAFKHVAGEYIKDPNEIAEFMLEHEAKVNELTSQDVLLKASDAEILAAKDVANEAKALALIQKRNAAKQTLLTLNKYNWIKKNYGNKKGGLSRKDVDLALKHFIGGTLGKFTPGASASVARIADAMNVRASGNFLRELESNNLDKFFSNESNHKAIMIELGEIRPEGKPGRSGNEAARKVAEIMEKHQEALRQEANANGAFIEKLPGYIMAQTHDPAKLGPRKINGKLETTQEAFKRWSDFIKPKLDYSRTFKGQNVDKTLKEMWQALVSGVHLSYETGIGIKTSGNRAQSLSNSRKIFFKDGESFYEYNEAFGSGNLVLGYIKGIERLSKNTALMREMGANPQKMIDDIYKMAQISISRSEGDISGAGMGLDNVYHWDQGVTNLFIKLTGRDKIPASNTLAKVGIITRGAFSQAMLGMSTISSFSDIGVQLSQAVYMGMSRHVVLGNMIKTLTDLSRKGLTQAERQMLSSFGLVNETLIDQIHEHINMGSLGTGWMAKLQNMYFKLIGLDWWTSSLKKAYALSLNNELGTFLGDAKQFGEFKPRMQELLTSYNLGKNEMEVLKQMPLIKENGRYFIDANYANKIPDKAVADYLGITETTPGYSNKIKDTKYELESRLRTFIYDRVRAAALEPDTVINAWATQGTQVGTPVGEGIRSIMQFKSFAMSMLGRAVNPWVFNTTGKELTMGLAELIMATTVLGYLSITCKDVLKGRNPRELNTDTVMKSLIQGGALGIVGDVLFGEGNGPDLVSALAGPGAGFANDLYRVYTAARDGDDAAATALKRFRNYVPGQNIYYLKLPLDYLLINRLQEWANPGYLDRMQQNLQNKTGQDYWLDPGTFVR